MPLTHPGERFVIMLKFIERYSEDISIIKKNFSKFKEKGV